MKKEYDYLIVGAGIYGSTFAHVAHQKGKRCLVIDKRPHLGGMMKDGERQREGTDLAPS